MRNYTVDNFPYEIIRKTPVVKRGRRNHGGRNRKYKDIVCAFDIETSRLPEQYREQYGDHSFMYIWQFAYGKDCVILGRTWEEFKRFIANSLIQLEDCCLAIYVHNLSFEFTFLKGIYNFMSDEVFVVDRRKILKCSMYNKFEFRCSYLQTNMGLDKFLKQMDVENKKLSLDYTITRYPWTRLYQDEVEYCINDVVGLVQAIRTEMVNDGDNLETIPPTSTGYVRRDTKRAMRKFSHDRIVEIQPTYDVYTLLREAFRGGNTHANRYYVGEVIKDVGSYDIKSSYPAQICMRKYPMQIFKKSHYVRDLDTLGELIFDRDKAVIFKCKIFKISLINKWWGCPYLSKAKCRYDRESTISDNGRILEADWVETTVTDVDWAIIIREYSFEDVTISNVYYSTYDYLPQPIIETNMEYFRRKTLLDGEVGEEYYYMKSKNKLNSVYGMMAQNPVKQSIEYIGGEDPFKIRNDDERELLKKAESKAFLSYAWGVWTTAWARLSLENGLEIAGKNFIYADTDSIKFRKDGSNQLENDFKNYNNKILEIAKERGAIVEKDGKTYVMGVYEHDGDYDTFATLGAKKYCYEKDGRLTITIAGVNKKKGGEELEELGGIQAFADANKGEDYELVFQKAGGTESLYNDNVDFKINIDGNELHITDNVTIRDSTYTLGITAEYRRLLRDLRLDF